MDFARHSFMAALTWLALAACSEPRTESAQFHVFGTMVEVILPDADPGQASALFASLQQEFQRMHREWHAWEPGELVRLNTAIQSGATTGTTPDILELLNLSQEMELRSGGRFNAAIGKLVALWGFHTSEYPVVGPPPSAERIASLLETAPSALAIELEEGALFSFNPEVQFDFGGIAKGFAVDLACRMIRRAGQASAMVGAGGDIRAFGSNHGAPWRIGVRDPSGGIAGGIEVTDDRAVFTSGNYERFREDAGVRYPHIIDPRSGWPVAAVPSVTVVAQDGARADAAATALVVAGPEEWLQVASSLGMDAVLVIDEAGRMQATPAMMKYFTPAEGREVEVVGRR